MNAETLRPAVFLDRDGVLNRAFLRSGVPVPPKGVEDFDILEGVPGACQSLRSAGFSLVVVTNQPDIARGTARWDTINEMHRLLRSSVELDAIYVCAHDDDDKCDCRKPLPGMILNAARDLRLDLSRSYCVGDRWRDIEAGQRAGVRTVHVDRDYAERVPAAPSARVNDMAAAARWILSDSYQGEHT